MKKYGLKILIASAVLVMLGMQGCSFFTKTPSATDTSIAQGAVNAAAVGVSIQYPQDKAPMLAVSAYIVNSVNSGSIVTMDQINAEIQKVAASGNLSPAALAAAEEFVVAMEPLMQQYLSQHQATDISKIPVQVCMVSQWINNVLGGSAKCATQLMTTPTGT